MSDDPMRVRILDSVEVNENGCWIWKRARQSKGYGALRVNGRTQLAHRVSFETFVGPIPEGMTLDHECHTNSTDCDGGIACRHRPCVAPAHLAVVTAAENNLRGQSPTAINARRTHCVNGHPFDAANTVRKANGRHRNCRTCNNASKRASHARKRDDLKAKAA